MDKIIEIIAVFYIYLFPLLIIPIVFWVSLRKENKRQALLSARLVDYLWHSDTVQIWLKTNLTGNQVDDVKVIRAEFGLDLSSAIQFWNKFQQQK